MSERINIESLKVAGEFLRKLEAPFREAGDPKGLAIGAMAYVVEGAVKELTELRAVRGGMGT